MCGNVCSEDNSGQGGRQGDEEAGAAEVRKGKRYRVTVWAPCLAVGGTQSPTAPPAFVSVAAENPHVSGEKPFSAGSLLWLVALPGGSDHYS